MISGIFGKTKPINFIILTGYLLLSLLLSQFLTTESAPEMYVFLQRVPAFLLLVFTVFLISFIDRKNHLSGNNSYPILLFTLWLGFFPGIFTHPRLIITHIFILLALRRLLNLKALNAVPQKLFDASFLICIATLFHSWSILYLILVYAAIIFYTTGKYRSWLIPVTAVIAVLILRYTYFIWMENDTVFLSGGPLTAQWNSLEYSPVNYFLPFIFLLVTGVFSMLAYGVNVMRKKVKKDPAFYLMIMAFLLAVALLLFFEEEKESISVFLIFPVAVLVTNALERLSKSRVREALLWVFFLLPVTLFFYRLSF